ncbi:M4 family metallopeptidase [Flavobacterium sp. 7A]|uniref:M4 family metallopeptidase n=1 Tax=Flavobacterium sp. 7A TaxID=2940571 RepID=UPI0022275ECE|nr:M4 family metallopeptidase [Flavobacterium sp. 7A]MCW2119279.1 hypothetical protein [Flavobacterium sp. 7A]
MLLKDPIIKHIQGSGITRYSGQRTFETQQNGSQYKLRDYSRGNGIETYNMNNTANYAGATDFTDNDNNWTSSEYNNANKDNAALDAHWGTEKTYDYFFIKHNRNSYNNSGAVLKNYVHANLIAMGYPSNDNAFWDGQRMTYGDGTYTFSPLTSIDVVGHEIGHGVCSNTANLIYSKESGAINEGLSDIWGAMIEYYADPTKQTYLIGEEIKIGGGALRSMSNPNVYNQPKTYGGTYWYDQNCTPNNLNDYCGVHRNSGVMNHWFYILSEGKTDTNDIGNAYSVTGIGKDKAAKIVYRAESVYFTSTTNYSQARDLTIQAAKDLYGANSVEVATTCQSWYAVGVGNNNCVALLVDISGDSVLCSSSTNSTYTVSNLLPGSIVNWSISTNALLLVSSNNTSITVKPINATYNGVATITANIDGNPSTKKIWIGKPSFNISRASSQEETCDTKYHYIKYVIGNSQPSETYTIQTFTTGITTSFAANNRIIFNVPKNYTGLLEFKVKGTNSCGLTDFFMEDMINVCGATAELNNSTATAITFKVYPNPTEDIVNIDLRDQNNQPEKGVTISGELFDLMGQSKSKIEIINNKASFSVNGLIKGIYILKLFLNDKSESHQIIVK